MKNRFRKSLAAVLSIALVALLAWPAVIAAQVKTGGAYYYFFQVQNEYGEPFTADAYVNCSVYTTQANGGGTTSVVHSAASLAQGTGLAGPLYSSTNGIIHWYSASTNPYNVVCFTKDGSSGRRAQMTINQHQLKIDTSGMEKVVRFPWSTNTAQTDTGVTIPEGALITGVAIQVATPATSGLQFAHIDVGFLGTHSVSTRNALVNRYDVFRGYGFSVLHQGGALGTGNGVAVQNHLGAALTHTITQGSGTPTNTQVFNGAGYMVHVTGGLRLSYDTSSSAGIGGHVYVFFRLLHVQGTAGGF